MIGFVVDYIHSSICLYHPGPGLWPLPIPGPLERDHGRSLSSSVRPWCWKTLAPKKNPSTTSHELSSIWITNIHKHFHIHILYIYTYIYIYVYIYIYIYIYISMYINDLFYGLVLFCTIQFIQPQVRRLHRKRFAAAELLVAHLRAWHLGHQAAFFRRLRLK